MKKAYLKTKHGFIFKVKVRNEVDYTHFGCPSWEHYARLMDLRRI